MIDSDADQSDFVVSQSDHVPLAETLRPTTLESFVGQEHLLARGKPCLLYTSPSPRDS